VGATIGPVLTAALPELALFDGKAIAAAAGR
jgi:hypothetical protein